MGAYAETFTGQSQGTSNWIPNFGDVIIGGWGRIRTTANIDGTTIQSDYRWIDIGGQNRARNDVIEYIRTNGGNDAGILIRIMCYESLRHQFLQFRPESDPGDGSREPEPIDNRIPSSDNPGAMPGGQPRPNRPVCGVPSVGIGIAQRDPAPFPSEHWNWQSNVQGGINFYYREKIPIARDIYRREQNRLNRQRREATAIINWARSRQSPPLPPITLPAVNVTPNSPLSLSAEQWRWAKIRAYNGGFNYRLDYYYQIDPDFLNGRLQGTGNWIEDPGVGYEIETRNLSVHNRNFTLTTYTWRQVPAARRDYVNRVESCR